MPLEISTDTAVNALIAITPYISEIAGDKELRAVIEKHNQNPNDTGAFLLEAVPMFLKKYKKAAYCVIGVLYNRSPEEIANQSFAKTLTQIKEIGKNEDLISFFGSFAKADS